MNDQFIVTDTFNFDPKLLESSQRRQGISARQKAFYLGGAIG